MALDSLVRAAKRNTPQPATYDPSKEAKIIEAEERTSNTVASAVNAVEAAKLANYPEKNWRQCKYLKKGRDDDTPLCSQFFGWCAKENCKPKFMKF